MRGTPGHPVERRRGNGGGVAAEGRAVRKDGAALRDGAAGKAARRRRAGRRGRDGAASRDGAAVEGGAVVKGRAVVRREERQVREVSVLRGIFTPPPVGIGCEAGRARVWRVALLRAGGSVPRYDCFVHADDG